jgi:uncharacterized protein (DUF1778 family)
MAVAKKRTKDELINLRTNPEQKSIIQKAADLLGVSTASFILEHSLKAARRELAGVEELRLAKRDAEIFLSALENPPKANAALKKAFQEHERRVNK